MLLDRLAESFARRRGRLALAVVLLTALAAFGLTRTTFDDAPRAIFRSEDEDFRLLEEVFGQFGSDDNDCVLLVEADDLFTPDSVAALRGLVAEVAATEGIESVQSLVDVRVFVADRFPRSLLPRPDASPDSYDRARREALAHPLVAGYLVSEDAKATLVIARIATTDATIRQIKPVVDRLHTVARHWTSESGLRVRMTGVPPIRAEIFTAVRTETGKFITIGATLAFVMAFLLFHRIWAVLIVSLSSLLGACWTLGALGLVGEKINVITTVLPTLVMVIGFADAVHLIVDMRGSRAAGLSPLDSAKGAVRHLGVACALTSLTTAVGFASLAVAEVDIIRRFGLSCAAGAVLTFFVVIVVVPLAASTRLGLKLHLVTLGRPGSRPVVRAAEAMIDGVLRHRWAVTIVGFVLTAALATSAMRLHPDAQLTEAIPPESESYQALEVADRSFGGVLTAFVVVDWPESEQLASPDVREAIAAAVQLCGENPHIHHPISILDLLASVPQRELRRVPESVLTHFIRPDLRRALVTMRLTDEGSSIHEVTFQKIRQGLAAIESEHPGIRLRLTGSTVLASRNLNRMILDLAKSLGLAAVVIFSVMTVTFRSIRLGLISVVPNTLPLAMTSSILVWTGQPLRMTSVIVFSVCLGIAVDDTIHFLNRFQREMKIDGDTNAAIRRAFMAVGAALVTTTVVLLTGFASVLLSEMPTSRTFAWLSCTAIGSALVGDLVLLPAMLSCFARGGRLTQGSAPPA